MKHNHFSFQLAQYSRKGSINLKHINLFLDQLSSAIIKYTWKRVYNMYETSVRINNGKTNATAPIWTEKVFIEGNEKECFTSIGTCNHFEKFPLIIIRKGKTYACLSKFRADDKADVWKSVKGWVDEDNMILYLILKPYKINNFICFIWIIFLVFIF